MTSSANTAKYRFYGELNDHLPLNERHGAVEKHLLIPASVKDAIESLGVPHPEVDLILVNGRPADFSQLVANGDTVAVYPPCAALEIHGLIHLYPEPLVTPRFVLDVHLGRLAAYLRMLGFDTLYSNCMSDPELVRISSEEQRILLTRDRGVLKHSAVVRGYWLRETPSRRQVAEIVTHFHLGRLARPFSRCMVCNEPLRDISRAEAAPRVPPKVQEWCNTFRECLRCERVYWHGSHSERMQSWMEQLVLSSPEQ